MVSDKEIYQAAHTLVQRLGKSAEMHALSRADELLDQGDIDGERLWLRIVDAIRELLSTEVTGPVN